MALVSNMTPSSSTAPWWGGFGRLLSVVLAVVRWALCCLLTAVDQHSPHTIDGRGVSRVLLISPGHSSSHAHALWGRLPPLQTGNRPYLRSLHFLESGPGPVPALPRCSVLTRQDCWSFCARFAVTKARLWPRNDAAIMSIMMDCVCRIREMTSWAFVELFQLAALLPNGDGVLLSDRCLPVLHVVLRFTAALWAAASFSVAY